MDSENIIPLGLWLILIVFAIFKIKEWNRSNKFWSKERARNRARKFAIKESEAIRLVQVEQENAARKPSADLDYINKDVETLEDFIITDQINEHDLQHLSFLNKEDFYFDKGWYPLIIEMIIKLDKLGWKRKISFKEKFGELRISIYEMDKELNTLTREYERKSFYICERCGKRGEFRVLDDCVACHLHYTMDRGWIIPTENGFSISYLEAKVITWSEVMDAKLLKYNHSDTFYAIEFTIENSGLIGINDNRKAIRATTDCRGFGSFAKTIPIGFESLDYQYLTDNFSEVTDCPVCGYRALFFKECECCESSNFENSSFVDISKLDFVKDCQLEWCWESGEETQKEIPFYSKVLDHKVLFDQAEYDEYVKEAMSDMN